MWIFHALIHVWYKELSNILLMRSIRLCHSFGNRSVILRNCVSLKKNRVSFVRTAHLIPASYLHRRLEDTHYSRTDQLRTFILWLKIVSEINFLMTCFTHWCIRREIPMATRDHYTEGMGRKPWPWNLKGRCVNELNDCSELLGAILKR